MIQGFVFYVDSEKDCSGFRKQIIYNSEKYEKAKILYSEKYEKIECNATLCTFRSKKRTKTIFTFWGGIIADSWDYEQDAGDSEDSENGFGIPKVNENNEKYENFEYDLFSFILIFSRVFGIIYDFRN